MKKIEEVFLKFIGSPIPKSLLPEEIAKDLVPLLGTAEKALLFGSPIATRNIYLVQGDINRFIKYCPKGYFLIGFWGHGINSYAFYYSKVDSWSKIFFRLPYGGVYMDNEKMALSIIAFLIDYIGFEAKIRNKIKSLVAVESMGEGYYKLVLPKKKILEFRESLFINPSFEERFLPLLNNNFIK